MQMTSSKKTVRKPSKKKSKSKSVWKCKEGCDLSTGVICKHLEALLPAQNAGGSRTRLTYVERIENLAGTENALWRSDSDEDISKLIHKMRSHGIGDLRIAILIDRIVRNRTYREIVEEYSISSIEYAQHLFKTSLAMLKSKGFNK